MKIAFLTEMGFTGKVPVDHQNMRTEFAWMYASDADHYSIRMFSEIKEDQDPFDPKMEPSGLKSLYKYDHLIPRIVRFLKGTC